MHGIVVECSRRDGGQLWPRHTLLGEVIGQARHLLLRHGLYNLSLLRVHAEVGVEGLSNGLVVISGATSSVASEGGVLNHALSVR